MSTEAQKPKSESDKELELKLLAETWKTTIEVQQHFNELAMKIRAAFVTVVLALFAAEGFLFEKRFSIDVLGLSISLTVVLPLIGIVGTYLFYFVDYYWYHQLLLGAVNHGRKLEELYPQYPALGLTSAIGQASQVVLKSRILRGVAFLLVRDKRYRNERKLHSDARMELFYKPVVAIFAIMFVIAILAGGILWKTETGSDKPSPPTVIAPQVPSAVSAPQVKDAPVKVTPSEKKEDTPAKVAPGGQKKG